MGLTNVLVQGRYLVTAYTVSSVGAWGKAKELDLQHCWSSASYQSMKTILDIMFLIQKLCCTVCMNGCSSPWATDCLWILIYLKILYSNSFGNMQNGSWGHSASILGLLFFLHCCYSQILYPLPMSVFSLTFFIFRSISETFQLWFKLPAMLVSFTCLYPTLIPSWLLCRKTWIQNCDFSGFDSSLSAFLLSQHLTNLTVTQPETHGLFRLLPYQDKHYFLIIRFTF